MKRFALTSAFALLAIAVAAPSSQATFTPLLAGGNVPLSLGTSSDLANNTLVATNTYTLTNPNNGSISASVVVDVFQNNTSKILTFAYQERNTGTNTLSSLSPTDFSNVTTSVEYLTDGGPSGSGFTMGGTAGSTATRNSTPGAQVVFNYATPLTTTSALGAILLIQTNATSFNSNGALVTNSSDVGAGSAGIIGVLQPASVPEPSSLIMLSIAGAIVGVGSYARRRKA